jgi:outer membrane receptor protein involved in Fe transport
MRLPESFFYGDKGIPKGYANGSYDDFAPRIGLAWDPVEEARKAFVHPTASSSTSLKRSPTPHSALLHRGPMGLR